MAGTFSIYKYANQFSLALLESCIRLRRICWILFSEMPTPY
jgi:hypothetical protein